MREDQYLTITALSANDTFILTELARLTAQYGCSVVSSAIQRQHEYYIINFLLCGSWSAIAKVENVLAGLSPKYAVKFLIARTTPTSSNNTLAALAYMIYITAPDTPQQCHKILHYLTSETGFIQDFFVESYKTRTTQAAMLNITARIVLPTDTLISEWRERFIVFCDEQNIDAAMEPEKY